MSPYRYTQLSFVLILLSFFTTILHADEEKAKWAVYWYLCGSDLESRSGFATGDLEEALEAKLGGKVRLIIYADGAKIWENDLIKKGKGMYLEVIGEDIEVHKEFKSRNMGDPTQLKEFLQFCHEEAPAEKTALIFWNHGGGSCNGVAFDENFSNDYLSLKEIREVLSELYEADTEAPYFDLIGFDACLMGTIENAASLVGYGAYMVASQELEPGTGWKYDDLLGAIVKKPSIEPDELGRIICDSFLKGCKEVGQHSKATLSVIDLSTIPALSSLLECAVAEMLMAVEGDNFPEQITALGRNANKTENYGGNTDKGGYTDMLDLAAFIKNSRSQFPEAAKMIEELLQKTVVYKINGPNRKSGGISIYYPLSGDSKLFQGMLNNGTAASGMSMLHALQFGISEEVIEGLIEQMEEKIEGIEGTLSNLSGEGGNDGEDGEDGEDSPSSGSGWFSSLASGSPNISEMSSSMPASAIEELEDTEVHISDDGEAYVELGNKAKLLESVSSLLLLLTKDDDGEILYIPLGEDGRVESDWEKGIFTETFDGTWPCFDGEPLMMELSSADDSFINYSTAINLNGEEAILDIVYDRESDEYRPIGARKAIGENGQASRNMHLLREGDKITFLSFIMGSDAEDETDFEIGSITYKKGSKITREHLGDGQFALSFQFKDLHNKEAMSDVIFFSVKDEEITTSTSIDPDEID